MSAVRAGLEDNGTQTAWAESGSYALSKIADRDFDLVVTDENLVDMTGLELIKTAVKMKPLVNFAAVSSRSSKEFHEASEGLGILMQLPVNPGYEQAKQLLEHLKKIQHLSTGAA